MVTIISRICRIIVIIVSSISYIMSITIVIVFISMIDIIIIISRGPRRISIAFPIVIKVFVVGNSLGSLCATAISTRWASACVAAVWWAICSPIAFHKRFAVPAGRKDLVLWATVVVQEGGECAHALNAMLLELRQESPVLVLVALGHELPGEIGLPLFDLIQPSYQDAVVERRCGAFCTGGARHGAPFLQCCVLRCC